MISGTNRKIVQPKEDKPISKKRIGRKAVIALAIILIVALVFELTKKVDIVIIGVDNVDNYSKHADTIIIGSFSPFKKNIEVVSIPRDTLVMSDNLQRMKINELFAHGYSKGGYKRASGDIIKKIEEIIGRKLHYYLCVDYEGFVNFIDQIGGVEVNVREKMKYDDNAGNLHINLAKGLQTLDGKKSLNYVRFRKDRQGDIGRIKRQQEFLSSLLHKMKVSGVYTKLPQIIKYMLKYTNTNLYPHNMLVLANTFRDIDIRNITMRVLPGSSILVNGTSYWQVNVNEFNKIKKEENWQLQ